MILKVKHSKHLVSYKHILMKQLQISFTNQPPHCVFQWLLPHCVTCYFCFQVLLNHSPLIWELLPVLGRLPGLAPEGAVITVVLAAREESWDADVLEASSLAFLFFFLRLLLGCRLQKMSTYICMHSRPEINKWFWRNQALAEYNWTVVCKGFAKRFPKVNLA